MGTLLALLLIQQKEIDAAVRKGLEVVKTTGTGELALWTLVRCEVPENDPALQGLLRDMLARPPESTTSAALQAMVLEELDRLKYRDRIAHGAQLLIDTQCRDGRWGVGHPVEAPELPPPLAAPPRPGFGGRRAKPMIRQRIKLAARGEGGDKGDSVLSRWAVWGLLAGHESGLTPPAEVVERAAAAWRKGDHDAADVVSCLCVCDYLLGKDWKKDSDVLKAVERLAAEKRSAPGPLYVLKSAMFQFNSATLGGVEWYPRDAKILLESQKPDGSWGGLEDTCYAILALHVRLNLFHGPDRK